MRMTKLRAKVRNGSIEREQRRNVAQGRRVRPKPAFGAIGPRLHLLWKARASSSRGCNI